MKCCLQESVYLILVRSFPHKYLWYTQNILTKYRIAIPVRTLQVKYYLEYLEAEISTTNYCSTLKMQTAISSGTFMLQAARRLCTMLQAARRLCTMFQAARRLCTMFQISQSACEGIHDGTVALPCAVWPNAHCAVFPHTAAVCSDGKFELCVSVNFSLLKLNQATDFKSLEVKYNTTNWRLWCT